MHEVWGSDSASQDAQARRLIESAWARPIRGDVYLSIMALPGAGVITAAS